MARSKGQLLRVICLPNGRKLIITEEKTLEDWILSLDARGLPPRVQMVSYIANLLLASRGITPLPTVGQNWAINYVSRYDILKTAYFWKYDK